jgi:hypothetical protein
MSFAKQRPFNVSGATIALPPSFGMLAAILAKRRKLAPRTLIEITETAAIADLESAGKAIASLRAMGYRVGLDDFGAGAASVNYLHAFQVDFVKFAGALIVKIGNSKRDDALVAGLAKLCGEMGGLHHRRMDRKRGLGQGCSRHGLPSLPRQVAGRANAGASGHPGKQGQRHTGKLGRVHLTIP